MIHSKQEDGFRGIQEGSTVAETEKKLIHIHTCNTEMEDTNKELIMM